MGRSIVFSKNTPKKQVRKTLRRGIQALLAVACVAPMYLDSAAQAQIRTGRQANRDYYPQATSANVPRSSSHQPSSHQPSGHPLRDPRQAEVYASASKSQRSLESISDDPPSQDLPRLSSSDQAESLPKVLANKTTSNQPAVSRPTVSRATVNRPVVTEVAQAKLETQSQVHDRSDSGPPPSSIALASHPAATKQVPEGYVVDDPMGEPNIHSTCGDPACSECGPGYPTLNIRIGIPPLFRCDRITARLEAATFFPSSQSIPSLVRTAEIGVPGSTDLFGGTENLDQSVQGVRGEFGWLFGMAHCNTLQFRFFDAGAQSLTFDSPTVSTTSIVRPYQDGSVSPIVQDSVSIREPGISNGSVLAHAFSEVQGGDVLFKRQWLKNCDSTTDWLVGYQTARLTDSIDVHSTTLPTGSTTLLELRDQFRTVNRFQGAAFGLSRMVYSPRWSLGSMFKLGLGDMQRDVTIAGFQKVGSAAATNNGLLARSPASGVYSSNTFVFSPEVNVTLGYRLTQNLEATLGYTYLGLPKVARAGEQIDTVADLDSANATRPRFTLQESNFSLHSLNYGLQYRY